MTNRDILFEAFMSGLASAFFVIMFFMCIHAPTKLVWIVFAVGISVFTLMMFYPINIGEWLETIRE